MPEECPQNHNELPDEDAVAAPPTPEDSQRASRSIAGLFSRGKSIIAQASDRFRRHADQPVAISDVATSSGDLNDSVTVNEPTANGILLESISVESVELSSLERQSRFAAAVMAAQAGAQSTSIVVRDSVAKSIVSGIRLISVERDRDEIIRWFIGAREILATEGLSKVEIGKRIFASIDTVRTGKLLANSIGTSLRSFKSSSLPLALKIAIPVTAVGTAILGAEGAGIAAFGSAIGAPVALLLFLGTAGATSIIEAFVRDRSVRDPLTRLMLTFVEFETARRAKKELLDALRADAMTPERAEAPEEFESFLQFAMEMDPIRFERHVMSFFEQCGHPTGLTARSNDFGVDGYVMHPDGVIVVQCKRYAATNPVGRPALQQFKGVIEEQAAYRGYFVTTSRFTNEARESAEKSNRIVLIDGPALFGWHSDGFRL